MQFDLSAQARPFVYIQYATPQPSERVHSDDVVPPIKSIAQTESTSMASQEPSIRRKRQQVGYACDKCRERRVGCDRGKPVCGQCRDKYTCVYSNHALRLDNVSMRQRMDDMQATIQRMSNTLAKLETDYHTTMPLVLRQQVDSPARPPQRIQRETHDTKENLPNVTDWAIATGWSVTEKGGLMSIQTDITNYDALREAVRRALQLAYHTRVPLFSKPPSPVQLHHSVPLHPQAGTSHLAATLTDRESKRLSFSVFESLGRLHTPIKTQDADQAMDMSVLEMDVMSRLIGKHHQCSFPILLSPSRFERHYKQGELKPLVLSSLFCHAVPHACIYHPQLVKIKDFHDLGQKFYNHSRMELGLDENPNLSNIHQRTFLITYDLDVGRVRRAFLHLGIAIRMCFSLNLHRPEGYLQCKTQFEREQAKRVFWTVWFFDSMVPHFFSQPRSMATEDVTIELPAVMSDFDQLETDQTRFAISFIHIRQIAAEIAEAQRANTMGVDELLKTFEDRLAGFQSSLAPHLHYSYASSVIGATTTTFARRTYFCVLLDFCQCWISLYRPHLPTNEITLRGKQAILRTSQAALAMTHLFEHWFRASAESSDGFDCFFRPYLYHYMSIIQIFKLNTTKEGRSSLLVHKSRAALLKLLHMYRTTPTYRSFGESQLEKDLMSFIASLGMDPEEDYNENSPEDDLMDDPDAECGWGLFSTQTHDGSLHETTSMSSGRSTVSGDPHSIELDMDYF